MIHVRALLEALLHAEEDRVHMCALRYLRRIVWSCMNGSGQQGGMKKGLSGSEY